MKKFVTALLAITLVMQSTFALSVPPMVRIKDIADIEGVRSNMLIGYGLVVGLAGTGDSVSSIPFTRQTLINMLERLGVNAKAAEDSLKMKNVAAVMVTAQMPAFARQGSKLDVTISSLGDSGSLEGGVLLATPLLAADGNVYAISQGSVIVGGFSAEGAAGNVSKNHTTVARVAEGAIVERETGFELTDLGDHIRLILKNPDFTTAKRVSEAVDKALGFDSSKATDHSTVDISVGENGAERLAEVIDTIQNARVQPDTRARVIIDEKTGTIVMGEDVRISDVAISHANLTIRVSELQQASQPQALSQTGETTTLDRTAIEVDAEEGTGKFRVFRGGANLADLVNGLNSLGVKPRDIISILQNVKAAGAMQAELLIM